MLKHSLLIVAALAWVAPVSAGAPSTAHVHAKGKCTKAHTKVAQANPGVAKAQTIVRGVTVPAGGSIFSLGRSSLLAP